MSFEKILPGIKSNQNGYRKFNITVETITPDNQSGYIKVPDLCNGFTVTNIGDTTIRVNRKILFPSATPATDLGDSVSFGGNEGEIYTGNLQLQFVAPAGAAPQAEIIFKFYIKD